MCALGQEVVLATYDRQLWAAAPRVGLQAWPVTLPKERVSKFRTVGPGLQARPRGTA